MDGHTGTGEAQFEVGDEVKFAAPLTRDEEEERFIVMELRGDRILVALKDSGMSIVPTFVYAVEDLVVLKPIAITSGLKGTMRR